jgi:hypothetical protein
MPQRHLGNNTKFERLKVWNRISHHIHGLVLFNFFGHDTQQVPLGITIKKIKKRYANILLSKFSLMDSSG